MARSYSSDQVTEIVEHRLERLRSSWQLEHETLLSEIEALQAQVDELEAELARYRRQDIGAGTPLRPAAE